MKSNLITWGLTLVVASVVAPAAFAAPMNLVDPALTGNTSHDGWNPLTIAAYPGYPGFPGSGTWTTPMGSNTVGSDDATLMKTSGGGGGGPYPTSGGIYFGGFSSTENLNGGSLRTADSTPLADVKNVVFQVQIGEVWTHDFYSDVLPVLNFNGGAQLLVPDEDFLLEQYWNGTVTMPSGEEDLYINTYLLQWDVSSLGPITSLELDFNGVQHAQVYALQLDQYDVWQVFGTVLEPAPEASSLAPEPGSLLCTGLGVFGLISATRRRRKSSMRT